MEHLLLYDAPEGGNAIPSETVFPVGGSLPNLYAEGVVHGGLREAWVKIVGSRVPVHDRVVATVLKADLGPVGPLADRTLHPDAPREPLVLKQTLPAEWTGHMRLSLSNAVAYEAPTGGDPIDLAQTTYANATLPRTVYLAGDGCGMGEAKFAVVVLADCATNVPLRIFGVNATLDGVAENDEETPGGFIADRTTHTNAPRTALALAADGPAASQGTLDLTWNSSLIQMYSAPDGGTPLQQYSVPFANFTSTTLHVEGIAPGSNVLQWTYSEQTNCVDRILVTVLKVDSVSATIPATPCQTMRVPNTANPQPRDYVSTEDSASWAAGDSIILIEHSTQSINLQGSVNPSGTPVRWEVRRNPNDNAALKAAPFPVRDELSLSTQVGLTTTLSLDAVGSFSAICYVDINGNNQYDDQTDCGKFMNVVVARVGLHQDQSVARPNLQQNFVANSPVLVDGQAVVATLFAVGNGQWAWGNAGAEFRTSLDVVGGGADGRLGVDRVYSGWCNNVGPQHTITGTYENNHSSVRLLSNTDSTHQGVVDYITIANNLPQALNPVLAGNHPLLDTGRQNPGTGGATACLSSSTDTRQGRQNLALGERRVTEAMDSPGNATMVVHPKFPPSRLTAFTYDVGFRAYCVLWTGTQNGAPQEPGANLYSVANEIPWNIMAQFTLTWGQGGALTVQAGANNTIALGNAAAHDPVVAMESLSGEVCTPTVLSRAMDDNCSQ